MKAILDEVLWRACRHTYDGSLLSLLHVIFLFKRHSHTQSERYEDIISSPIKINTIEATVATPLTTLYHAAKIIFVAEFYVKRFRVDLDEFTNECHKFCRGESSCVCCSMHDC